MGFRVLGVQATRDVQYQPCGFVTGAGEGVVALLPTWGSQFSANAIPAGIQQT